MEAEIGPAEARQLQVATAELPPQTQDSATNSPTLQELIDRDPPLGLAQLRIEIEKELRRIYSVHFPDEAHHRLSLGVMANQLRQKDVLPAEIAGPLGEVLVLANRAIHGEYVPADVACDIADSGSRILGALEQLD